MSEHVISHRKPRRKYAGAWAWAAALMVTVLGIMAASWLAPDMHPVTSPISPSAPRTAQPTPAQSPNLATIDPAVDLALPPPPRARRPRPQSSVPLDAGAAAQTDGYEILSAAELAGISQARD